jgi:uncharacterized alkaline shock family protein YloU
VVASIVGHAANECYGVVGMAARGLRDGIAERLNRETVHRGVEVEVRDGGLVIELYIIAQYGTRISEVAHNLMSAVKYEVERTLGLDVIAVNVNVQGANPSARSTVTPCWRGCAAPWRGSRPTRSR